MSSIRPEAGPSGSVTFGGGCSARFRATGPFQRSVKKRFCALTADRACRFNRNNSCHVAKPRCIDGGCCLMQPARTTGRCSMPSLGYAHTPGLPLSLEQAYACGRSAMRGARAPRCARRRRPVARADGTTSEGKSPAAVRYPSRASTCRKPPAGLSTRPCNFSPAQLFHFNRSALAWPPRSARPETYNSFC